MLRRRRLPETTESLVSDQQQQNFRSAFKRLNFVNIIGWSAAALNAVFNELNPLNTSQLPMETADYGLTRAIISASESDKKGLHLEASKRREKIYFLHAGVAFSNFPITYLTWDNTADISPRSLALSATVGFLSLVGLYRDTKNDDKQYDNTVETDESIKKSSLIHRQNNVAVRYINGSNLAEAGLAIAGAGAYGFYEKAPAVATMLTGAAVGGLMIKGAFSEHSFRNDNLVQI